MERFQEISDSESHIIGEGWYQRLGMDYEFRTNDKNVIDYFKIKKKNNYILRGITILYNDTKCEEYMSASFMVDSINESEDITFINLKPVTIKE